MIYYTVQTDGMNEEAPAAYERVHQTWTVHRFCPWTLLIVCYGPQAVSNAGKIRSFLFLDGYSLPRSILRKAGIYPVPEPKAPMEIYEPEGSDPRRDMGRHAL